MTMEKLSILDMEQTLINQGQKNTISLSEDAIYRLYKIMIMNGQITGKPRMRFMEHEADRIIKRFENSPRHADIHVQEIANTASHEHEHYYSGLLTKIREQYL